MLEVKVGEILTDIKKGDGKNGTWALCKLKAVKGYDSIDVWISNPEDVGNSPVRIKKIESVKKTARKYEKDGQEKWADVYSMNVEVEVADTNGFAKLDENLPF